MGKILLPLILILILSGCASSKTNIEVDRSIAICDHVCKPSLGVKSYKIQAKLTECICQDKPKVVLFNSYENMFPYTGHRM